MKRIDLTGQRFGWLVVIEQDYNYAKEHQLKKNDIFWKCQCDCGNFKSIRSYSLTSGQTKSCGCFKTTGQQDLTGLKKGLIEVLGPDFEYTKDHKGAFWKCKCQCGTIFPLSTNQINKSINPRCEKCAMPSKNDLTGQVFNYLTVLGQDFQYAVEHNVSKASYWKCRCVCGKETTVRVNALIDGTIKSCGCKKAEITRLQNMKDITGQHFGKLTAIEPVFDYAKIHQIKNNSNTIYWKCLCECGNYCEKPYNDLAKGIAKNCPNCTQRSNGEQQIKKILIENNISFVHDREYFKDLIGDKGLLRYDFILLNKENKPIRIVEYDGKQHFKSIELFGGQERFILQQKYDNIKNQYAKAHNIPLVRIPYTITNITFDDIITDRFLI